ALPQTNQHSGAELVEIVIKSGSENRPEDGCKSCRDRFVPRMQLMAGPVAFETGHSGLGFLGKTQVVSGFWAPARANMPLPLSRRNFALYWHCFGTAFIAELAFDC